MKAGCLLPTAHLAFSRLAADLIFESIRKTSRYGEWTDEK